jgi:hypothetical protein
MNMHIGEHPSALIYYRFYLYLYDLFEQKMLSIDNHHSQSSPALVIDNGKMCASKLKTNRKGVIKNTAPSTTIQYIE